MKHGVVIALATIVATCCMNACNGAKTLFLTTCGSSVMDSGYNEMAYNAAVELELDFTFLQCLEKGELAGTIGAEDVLHVFLLGFGDMAEFLDAADKYPQVKFTAIDNTPLELSSKPNMQAAVFAEHAGSFVVGALAGLQTESKVVGGIFGAPFEALKRFRNGFISGVVYACPDCTILTQYIWAFGDVPAGATVARAMIQQEEADVIFAAAGFTGIGSLFEAAASGAWVIGVDNDQFLSVFKGYNETTQELVNPLADRILTSMMKQVGNTVKRVLADQANGVFSAGQVIVMDYTNDGIARAPCNAACDDISSATTLQVETIEREVASGTLSTNVDYQSGKLRLTKFFNEDIPANAWTPLVHFGATPQSFQGAAYDTLNLWGDHEVFVFGGANSLEGHSGKLWSFSLASLSWQEHHSGALVYGHGFNATDPAAGPVGEFPIGRLYSSITTLGDGSRFVLFGGLSSNGRMSDVWVFCTPIAFILPYERWQKLAPGTSTSEPLARDGHATVLAKYNEETQVSHVLVFGGRGSNDLYLQDLWLLEVGGDLSPDQVPTSSWTLICETCAPAPRRDAKMVSHEGKVYLFGGRADDMSLFKDLWMFDLDQKEWTQLFSAQFGRSRHVAQVVNLRPPGLDLQPVLLVHGGEFEEGVLERHRLGLEYYVFSTRSWVFVNSFGATEKRDAENNCLSAVTDALPGNPAKPTDRLSHVAARVVSSQVNGTDKLLIFGGMDKDAKFMLNPMLFHPSEINVLEDKMYSKATTAVALFLCATSTCCALGTLVWTGVMRKHPIVKMSQAPFLALISLGGVISSLTIIPIIVDDIADDNESARQGNYLPANHACMAQVWLYTGGFCLMFGPAFAKLHRVIKVFEACESLKRVRISNKQLFGYVMSLLLLDWVIVSSWQISDPLNYFREVTLFDEYGNALQSMGRCHSPTSQTYVVLIFTIHLCVLIYGVYISHRARHLSEAFSEGKHLQFALFSQLELLAITTPVLVMVSGDPVARTFVMSGVIFLNTMSTLGFIFVPKVINLDNYNKVSATGSGTGPAVSMKSSMLKSPGLSSSQPASVLNTEQAYPGSPNPSVQN